MYDFKGQKVFYYTFSASSLGVCNDILYNCAGETIINLFIATSKEREDFISNRKNEVLLWEKK